VHGSAPKYAGKDVINPTAVILTAVMMLRHLGEFDAAADVEHAVLVTLDSGVLTRDIAGDADAASTSAYTDAIIANLGRRSQGWQVRDYKPIRLPQVGQRPDFVVPEERAVVGLDLFVESPLSPAELGASLMELTSDTNLSLKVISNRGRQVFPPTGAESDGVDHYSCRFIIRENPGDLSDEAVFELLKRVSTRHRWMHIEKLQEFDGELGFTRAQGEN
jgi:isocitrate dehydrogenase